MQVERIVKESDGRLPAVLKIAGARARIKAYNTENKICIVALDDDPTGCQTVHDIPILLNWEPSLIKEIAQTNSSFFILTNSRAYAPAVAGAMSAEICRRLKEYIPAKNLRIISRSDSTLRGHFMAEVEALLESNGPYDGILIIPYFKEGGRFTINDTHFVQQNEKLVPAHETEFAQDPVFGFRNSYLPSWIQEKSAGRWSAKDVASITLSDIRLGGPERICSILEKLKNNTPLVVNALCDEDVEVVVLGLCMAEGKGKRILYRSAASFVKVRAGITDAELYSPSHHSKKGLIIVGSHVQKSTEQFHNLMGAENLISVEVNLAPIFTGERNAYLASLRSAVDTNLAAGHSVVVYTERGYALENHGDKLQSGMAVSDFLSQLVAQLTETPDFIISKGGITSHDIAAKGLAIKEATVLGQIVSGVPVWRAAAGKFPGLTYVVFPGNVGDGHTLRQVYLKMR